MKPTHGKDNNLKPTKTKTPMFSLTSIEQAHFSSSTSGWINKVLTVQHFVAIPSQIGVNQLPAIN